MQQAEHASMFKFRLPGWNLTNEILKLVCLLLKQNLATKWQFWDSKLGKEIPPILRTFFVTIMSVMMLMMTIMILMLMMAIADLWQWWWWSWWQKWWWRQWVIVNYENEGYVEGSDNDDDVSDDDLWFTTTMMMAVVTVKMMTLLAMVLDDS